MTIDEIKELIRVVEDTGIAELELQRGDNRVRIRRGVAGNGQELVLPTGVSSPGPVPSQHVQSTRTGQHSPGTTLSTDVGALEDERNAVVKSPIVGTYYDAPSPDAAPFVKVGDRVHSKQVLCIIESMKLMNEIEAEVSGTIVAKLIENGRPVEYGEALFTIRPS